MSADNDDLFAGEAPALFDGRFDSPFNNPVQPHQLRPEDSFQFDCHPGVPCFNACCRHTDIMLTPFDIVRLKRRLRMRSNELVAKHTVPFEMDHQGMPGLRLLTRPGSPECLFLSDQGCTVYEDRPSACRYYALGNMGVRKKDAKFVEDVFFVVKEDHCKGHFEPKVQTVTEYRRAQGIDTYEEMNREWRDIIIKKRSSGPTVGMPSERSLQLFDMCSYDIDGFRDFVDSDGFKRIFDLGEATLDELKADEDKLLQFAFRFLKQVLFGEFTIPLKNGAREERLAARKGVLAQRKAEAVERWREKQATCDRPSEGDG